MYTQRCTNAGILQSTTRAEYTFWISCQKITFSTVGIRLGLLYTQRCTNAGTLQSTTRAEQTLDRACTSTVGKLLFPQSEGGWACYTPNFVQTLVFYNRLPGLNRHWIDLVHPLSENYFFHSRKKVGLVVHPTLYKRWYFTVDYQG